MIQLNLSGVSMRSDVVLDQRNARQVNGKLNVMNNKVISLEDKPWFYFTVDLNLSGHGVITLVRFVNVSDRVGAVVEIEDSKYFGFSRLILAPYQNKVGKEYFQVNMAEKLKPVWAFDGTKVGDADFIDLATDNILDKAAITPYESVVKEFGKE